MSFSFRRNINRSISHITQGSIKDHHQTFQFSNVGQEIRGLSVGGLRASYTNSLHLTHALVQWEFVSEAVSKGNDVGLYMYIMYAGLKWSIISTQCVVLFSLTCQKDNPKHPVS